MNRIHYRQRLLGLGAATLVASGAWTGVAGTAAAAVPGHAHRQHHSAAASRKLMRTRAEAIFLRMDVLYAAYLDRIYATAIPRSQGQQDAGRLRVVLAQTLEQLSKLNLPNRDAPAATKFVHAVENLNDALKTLQAAPDDNTYNQDFAPGGQLDTAQKQFPAGEDALREAIGLRRVEKEPLFTAGSAGKLIYRDPLTAPQKNVHWTVTPGFSTFTDGGFVISDPAGDTTFRSPSTPYAYDSRYIAVQVDATPTEGSPIYGLACSPKSGADMLLTGVILPGGQWGIYANANPQGNPASQMPYNVNGGTSSAVSQTGANHLRLDCVQFSPGLTVARMYDNGTYLGYGAAFTDFARSREPSLFEGSGSDGASSVRFNDWSVSELKP